LGQLTLCLKFILSLSLSSLPENYLKTFLSVLSEHTRLAFCLFILPNATFLWHVHLLQPPQSVMHQIQNISHFKALLHSNALCARWGVYLS
jgi:hypothetical protein